MKHTTKDGKTMLIAEMDNNHLSNTINLICSRISDIAQILDSGTPLKSMTKSQAVMLNIDEVYKEIDEEHLEDILHSATEHLQPYVFEASLRDMNVTPILQRTFKRSEALVIVNDSFRKYIGENTNTNENDSLSIEEEESWL